MLAFIEEFGFKAGLFCVMGQGIEVHIEPVERLSLYILILHLIVDLAVIVACQVYLKAAVFFLIEILEVA